MTLRDYFEQRAREGSWGALYRGAPNLANYNFLTRRAATARLLEQAPGCRQVLDVGCGTGDLAELVRSRGASYHGVDFAPSMVLEGRARWPSARFAVADGARLPFCDGAFDLVLALGYLAYFRDPQPPLAEIARVLRPGGLLVLQSSKAGLWGHIDRALLDPLEHRLRHRRRPPLPDGWVARRYSPRQLDRLLRARGFELLRRMYHHVQVVPGLLRRRWPRRAIQLAQRVEAGPPLLWRSLAVNHIGLYRRGDAGGDCSPSEVDRRGRARAHGEV